MTVLTPAQPSYQPAPSKVWTLADFYALPQGPPFYELDNGALIEMSKPHLIHQWIVFQLAHILMTYLDSNPIGDIWGDVEVQRSNSTVYVPDLCFIRNENRSISDGELAIKGIPDLVIEVLSPSTQNRDWNRKYEVYESDGVPFYWIIDPKNKLIWEYKNDTNGYFRVCYTELNEAFSPEIFPGLSFNLAQLMGKSPEKKEDNQNE